MTLQQSTKNLYQSCLSSTIFSTDSYLLSGYYPKIQLFKDFFICIEKLLYLQFPDCFPLSSFLKRLLHSSSTASITETFFSFAVNKTHISVTNSTTTILQIRLMPIEFALSPNTIFLLTLSIMPLPTGILITTPTVAPTTTTAKYLTRYIFVRKEILKNP